MAPVPADIKKREEEIKKVALPVEKEQFPEFTKELAAQYKDLPPELIRLAQQRAALMGQNNVRVDYFNAVPDAVNLDDNNSKEKKERNNAAIKAEAAKEPFTKALEDLEAKYKAAKEKFSDPQEAMLSVKKQEIIDQYAVYAYLRQTEKVTQMQAENKKLPQAQQKTKDKLNEEYEQKYERGVKRDTYERAKKWFELNNLLDENTQKILDKTLKPEILAENKLPDTKSSGTRLAVAEVAQPPGKPNLPAHITSKSLAI